MKRILIALGILSLVSPVVSAQDTRKRDPKLSGSETATFSMYCYWTGEATLGRVAGVLRSRIGHQAGNEIVEVDYDPQQTSLVDLAAALKRQGSFYSLIVANPEERRRAQGSLAAGEITVLSSRPHFIESKHSLRTRHPELYALDLTEEQAIALNSWSYFGGPMPDVLTAEQKRRFPEQRKR